MNKVKIRLRRVHFANGIRKVPGNVISLVPEAARVLVERRVADYIKDTATDRNRNRRNKQ